MPSKIQHQHLPRKMRPQMHLLLRRQISKFRRTTRTTPKNTRANRKHGKKHKTKTPSHDERLHRPLPTTRKTTPHHPKMRTNPSRTQLSPPHSYQIRPCHKRPRHLQKNPNSYLNNHNHTKRTHSSPNRTIRPTPTKKNNRTTEVN